MTDQEKLIKKLEKYQEDNKKDKYVQVLKHVDDYGYEVETHEYVCPNGSIGYAITAEDLFFNPSNDVVVHV